MNEPASSASASMSGPSGSSQRLSVVIPALNESELLPNTLARLDWKRDEVIVVDGGSSDHSLELARSVGAKVMTSRRGRASQMNAGARVATGGCLLFLHADTILPENYGVLINRALQTGASGGAFGFSLDEAGLRFRFIEAGVSLRARLLGLPYGDQAFFVLRNVFEKMGGFREMAIMEDFDFARRIRNFGRFDMLDARVRTSARRWRNAGTVRVTLLNQAILVGFLAGISTERLAGWYSRPKGRCRQSTTKFDHSCTDNS